MNDPTIRRHRSGSSDRRFRGTRWTAAAVVVGLSILGSCSSGTEHASSAEDAGAPAATATSAPLEGAAVDEAACADFSAFGQAMTGDPSAAGPVLDRLQSSLPSSLSAQGAVVIDGFRAAVNGDDTAMAAPEFAAANDELSSAMWAGCQAASRVDVTGVDYGFHGLPKKVPAGLMAVRFTNDSSHSEPHEMIVLKRPAGNDTPIGEIAKMSPDDLMADFQMMGVVFAEQPGNASASLVDLPAGHYVALCTIPVADGDGAGDPHAAHGMVAELEAT